MPKPSGSLSYYPLLDFLEGCFGSEWLNFFTFCLPLLSQSQGPYVPLQLLLVSEYRTRVRMHTHTPFCALEAIRPAKW